MKFIVIILSLIIERYLHAGQFLIRFNWFTVYLNMLKNALGETGLFSGATGMVLVLLPLLLVVGLLYYLLGGLVYHLVGLLIALGVLWYCLGPQDLHASLENYFTSTQLEKKEAARAAVKNVVVKLPENDAELARAVTQGIFVNFNTSIFAVLFWFAVLGPLGAVLYRVTQLTGQIAAKESATKENLNQEAATETKASKAKTETTTAQPTAHGLQPLLASAQCLQSLLDWIPVRLLGLGFALSGHFTHGFAYWIKNLCKGLSENQTFVGQTGLIALDVQDKPANKADIAENKAAVSLVERTVVLYLVVLVLLVVGSFF